MSSRFSQPPSREDCTLPDHIEKIFADAKKRMMDAAEKWVRTYAANLPDDKVELIAKSYCHYMNMRAIERDTGRPPHPGLDEHLCFQILGALEMGNEEFPINLQSPG